MPAVGQRFGHYELLELAGHDALGAVYRARDVRLGRTVALRLVPPDMTADAVVRARLNREVSVLAALDHPNVPPVYEAGEQDGRICIVSRWIDGVDLGTLVSQSGPLAPRRAVRIVNQVASALQAAHSVGIMNRVVKPSSVKVTATDEAYLTDFALARRSTDTTGLTVQEELVGDLDYLAPEYLAGGKPDARVDIYGLGSVLFEALTGEVPFPASGTAAKMYAHATSEPPSPRERRPEVPPRLDAVVRRALAKDPDQRQQSAAEFAAEAAGAVDLSAPPWAWNTGRPSAGGGGGARPPREAAAASQPALAPERKRDRHEDGDGRYVREPARADGRHRGGDGFYAPVYYRHDRRLRRPQVPGRETGAPGREPPDARSWVPWAVAGLIFFGVALALLVALT